MNPTLEKQMRAADAAMDAHGETQPNETDGRAVTSPANGKKGGRPAVDWGLLAEDFMAKTGCRAIGRKEGTYLYNPAIGAYRLHSPRELDIVAGGYLRGCGAGIPYSANGERNLAGALRASDGNLSLVPPVFLSTGRSAAGWIAMRNGLLDVEAAARGESVVLLDHTPDFFSTYALPYDWNPTAPCPRFMRFMEESQPDAGGRDMCQMLAGLLLVPDTSFQVFWILYGDGGCGKSTYMAIIREMLGRDNVCRVPLADFADKFKVGNLTQKLANLVDDSPTADGMRNSMNGIEGALKEATGGRATMNFEPKGVDADTSRLVTARCVFCQNPPLPYFVDRSEGLWRRLRVIPFPVRFDGTAARNPHLAEEIIADELPGVFAWAVRGLGRLRPLGGFPQSAAGEAIIAEHRATCDREKTFLGDRYTYSPGAFTPSSVIFAAYKEWCGEEGYSAKGGGNFVQEVRRVFPRVEHVKMRWMGQQKRGFLNLATVAEEAEEE